MSTRRWSRTYDGSGATAERSWEKTDELDYVRWGGADGVRFVGRPVWRRFVTGVAGLCVCRVKRTRDVTVVPSIGCCSAGFKTGQKKSNADKISKKLAPFPGLSV